jgi:Natural resistance-associated macrophage protein
MIAYGADGAQYGLGFFVPLIPVLFAMAFICQEMCMRVGAVTHPGYVELMLQRYGRAWGWFGAGDLILTNLVTLSPRSSPSTSGWPISISDRGWPSRSAWPPSTACSCWPRSWPGRTRAPW